MASIGSAFIELAIQGLQAVERGLNAVGEQVRNTTGKAVITVAVNGAAQARKQIEAVAKTPARKNAVDQSVSGAESTKGGLSGISSIAETVQSKLALIGGRLQQIGRASALGFGVATAAITKFVQLADPVGFERMQVAVAALGIQVGRIFVPLLHDATNAVVNLVLWFKNLDDGTRETILSVTKVGLALLAVGTALVPIVKIGSAFMSVATIIGSVGTGVGAAVAGIVAAIGLVGVALSAAQGHAVSFSNAGDLLKSAWAGLSGVFGQVVAAVKPIVAAFIVAFDQIGKAITPALAAIGKVIQTVIGSALGSVGTVFMKIANAILAIVPSAKQLQSILGGMQVYGQAIGNVFKAGFSLVQAAVEMAIPPIVVLTNMLMEGFARLFPLYEKIQAKVMNVVSSLIVAGQTIMAAFQPVIDDLVPLIIVGFDQMVTQIEMAFSYIEPQVNVAIKVIESFVNYMVTIWKWGARIFKSQIDIMYDAFKGFINFVNDAVDVYNDTIGKVAGNLKHLTLPEQKKLTVEEKYKPDPKGKEKQSDPDRFRGQVRRQNEIVAIEDLFKKNLTQDQNDPQLAIAREQRNEARTTNDRLGTIIEKLDNLKTGDLRV